jgi:phosphoglycerate kinase
MKKTIRDVDVSGRRVLVRADLNVPIKQGRILDDLRLRAAAPTLRYLRESGAKVIVCSHLGNPNGAVIEALRLDPVAERLADILDHEVLKTDDCVGPEAVTASSALKTGEIVVLENTRFHPGEGANDSGFSSRLAGLAEIFVNDAFASAHRAHASTVGVARWLPAVAGQLMEKEISILQRTMARPLHPFLAVLGGAGISEKIDILERLLPKLDTVLLGGALATTFMKAKGLPVGQSIFDRESLDTARRILGRAADKIVLPRDVVIQETPAENGRHRTVAAEAVPPEGRIVDIGSHTADDMTRLLSKAGMVIWNGPLGVCERSAFATGTEIIARVIAELRAVTVVGGGDSVKMVSSLRLGNDISHISTGGGAFLEFLAGHTLPAIASLLDA